MEDEIKNKNEDIEFKKPVLVGRIGKLPKKVKQEADNLKEPKTEEPNTQTSEPIAKSSLPPAVLIKELATPIPYKEPKWSGICPDGLYCINFHLQINTQSI